MISCGHATSCTKRHMPPLCPRHPVMSEGYPSTLPKGIVFRFCYHSEKVIGSLSQGSWNEILTHTHTPFMNSHDLSKSVCLQCLFKCLAHLLWPVSMASYTPDLNHAIALNTAIKAFSNSSKLFNCLKRATQPALRVASPVHPDDATMHN